MAHSLPVMHQERANNMQSITLIGIVFGMMTLITLGLIAVIRQQRQLSASQKDIATTLAELKITSQVQRSLQDTQQEKIQLFLDAQQNHFQKLQKQQHTDLQDGMSFLSKQLHSTLSQSAGSGSIQDQCQHRFKAIQASIESTYQALDNKAIAIQTQIESATTLTTLRMAVKQATALANKLDQQAL